MYCRAVPHACVLVRAAPELEGTSNTNKGYQTPAIALKDEHDDDVTSDADNWNIGEIGVKQQTKHKHSFSCT